MESSWITTTGNIICIVLAVVVIYRISVFVHAVIAAPRLLKDVIVRLEALETKVDKIHKD
jgi:uncharacterized protein HemY